MENLLQKVAKLHEEIDKTISTNIKLRPDEMNVYKELKSGLLNAKDKIANSIVKAYPKVYQSGGNGGNEDDTQTETDDNDMETNDHNIIRDTIKPDNNINMNDKKSSININSYARTLFDKQIEETSLKLKGLSTIKRTLKCTLKQLQPSLLSQMESPNSRLKKSSRYVDKRSKVQEDIKRLNVDIDRLREEMLGLRLLSSQFYYRSTEITSRYGNSAEMDMFDTDSDDNLLRTSSPNSSFHEDLLTGITPIKIVTSDIKNSRILDKVFAGRSPLLSPRTYSIDNINDSTDDSSNSNSVLMSPKPVRAQRFASSSFDNSFNDTDIIRRQNSPNPPPNHSDLSSSIRMAIKSPEQQQRNRRSVVRRSISDPLNMNQNLSS